MTLSLVLRRRIVAASPIPVVGDESTITLGGVARSLLDGARTEVVLLTLGPRGAVAFTVEGETRGRARQVEVVDTVGAGDAFMAATLAQLSDLDVFRRPGPGVPVGPDDLSRLLHGAMEVAALTCERRGANPPRRQELPPGWPG